MNQTSSRFLMAALVAVLLLPVRALADADCDIPGFDASQPRWAPPPSWGPIPAQVSAKAITTSNRVQMCFVSQASALEKNSVGWTKGHFMCTVPFGTLVGVTRVVRGAAADLVLKAWLSVPVREPGHSFVDHVIDPIFYRESSRTLFYMPVIITSRAQRGDMEVDAKVMEGSYAGRVCHITASETQ